jgi:hypothetical protein
MGAAKMKLMEKDEYLEALWSKKLELNPTEVERKERNGHEERGRDTRTIHTG